MCDDMGGFSDSGADFSADVGGDISSDFSADASFDASTDAAYDVDDFAEDADFLNDFETPVEDVDDFLEDVPDAIPLDELDHMTIEPIPEAENSPYYGEGPLELGADLELLGPEVGEESAADLADAETPEDFEEDVVVELTDSQKQRLADLDAGYAAVAADSRDIMEGILSDESMTPEEQLHALQNLREDAVMQAEEYHSYQQDILDTPEDGDAGYSRSRHR